jgi:hypothetical protein
LALVPTRVFRVTGRLRDERGAALIRSTVTLVDSYATLPAADVTVQIRDDGSFTLLNVVPGEYVLNVRATLPGGDEIASVPITVAADVAGLDVVTSKAATLEGQISVERGERAAFDLTRVTVVAVPRSGNTGLGSTSAAGVRTDGTFRLKGLTGVWLLAVQGLPPGWILKNAFLNGKDVVDTAIDLGGTSGLSDLTLIVTDSTGTLSGTVVTEKDEPARDCTVVLFPDDANLWALPSRYIHATRAGRDGRFEIRGLVPGQYRAVAVGYVAQDELYDPLFLESVRADAFTVSVAEARTETVQLTISRYR